jgi:hypothetical protein
MRNKKLWLTIKGIVIVLFAILIIAMPVADSFRKWLRFSMLIVFVISFIIDLSNYRKNNA